MESVWKVEVGFIVYHIIWLSAFNGSRTETEISQEIEHSCQEQVNWVVDYEI